MNTLSETPEYQHILEDLAWLNRNVKLDPPLFATDFLADIAEALAGLVSAVEDGLV